MRVESLNALLRKSAVSLISVYRLNLASVVSTLVLDPSDEDRRAGSIPAQPRTYPAQMYVCLVLLKVHVTIL